MTSFSVIVTPLAQSDIIESFLWGCENWGVEMATQWVNELRTAIEDQLPLFPERFSRAPDDDGNDTEYRQFFVGRYRVIFHIRENEIFVIHVRGAFSGIKNEDLGVDE